MSISIDPALQKLIRRRSASLLGGGTIDDLALRIDDHGKLLLYQPQQPVREHARAVLDNLHQAAARSRHRHRDNPDADQGAEL